MQMVVCHPATEQISGPQTAQDGMGGGDAPIHRAQVQQLTHRRRPLLRPLPEQLVGILTLTDLIHHFMDTLRAPQGHEAR